MRLTSTIAVLLAAAPVLGLAACGDDTINPTSPDGGLGLSDPDASPGRDSGGNSADGDADAGSEGNGDGDAGSDGDVDASTTDIKHITLKLEDVIAGGAPVGPSSYGFASDEDAMGGATDTSWRYQKPSTGAADGKFEFYIPLTAEEANGKGGGFAEIAAHLGDVTIADIQSIKTHSRRNIEASPDLTLLIYTVPHETAAENDASWYGRRLHADFAWADGLDAPTATWNTFSTAAGANAMRFWDYRNADVNSVGAVQPTANYFSLADMQKDPVTPTGVTGARDYRTEKIKYLTLSNYSNQSTFDGSVDGIEVTLKNGKGVVIDLAGDANVRRISVSYSQMLTSYPPSTGSSYGTPSDVAPLGSGVSWRYVKGAESPASEKFEFYLPFASPADEAAPAAIWDSARNHLGEFTIGDIDSMSVHSYKTSSSSDDFVMLIYTLPHTEDEDNDASWYARRIHAQLDWAGGLNAPADTWNAFSTNAGTNQLRFWDFRPSNTQPDMAQFTLADMQATPQAPYDLEARDYRTEKVRYVTFSTYTGPNTFDGSLDGIELHLKNGKGLIVDFDR